MRVRFEGSDTYHDIKEGQTLEQYFFKDKQPTCGFKIVATEDDCCVIKKVYIEYEKEEKKEEKKEKVKRLKKKRKRRRWRSRSPIKRRWSSPVRNQYKYNTNNY